MRSDGVEACLDCGRDELGFSRYDTKPAAVKAVCDQLLRVLPPLLGVDGEPAWQQEVP
jgi:hypothetical protein